MATESKQCPVCCDSFTAALRKPVCCAYCEFSACNVCTKTYLADGVLDPHCMSCRRSWNDEFLDMNFSRSWRTTVFRKHRETILMEREMAILPTRQSRVEAYHQRHEVNKKMKTVTSEMSELDKTMTELRRAYQIQSAWYTRYTAEYNGQPIPTWTFVYTHPEGGGREGKKVERAQFIMKCPDSECRGFLSSAYKCGTCQNWACPDCLVVKGKEKDTDHTCDPALKETVALIIKDSKACPKCGERISKIDGCDQMWCVDCHTAFSWASGKVINGVIHNPHYYEFLRKQGGDAPRNAGDIPCGGIPHYYTLSQRVRGLTRAEQTELMNIHRIVSEVSDQRAAQYQGQFTQEDNGDLGVRYLLREITREQMKAELSKREIKRSKQMAIRAVLEMFALTGAEILQRIVAHEGAITSVEVKPILEELRALRIYVNESLQQISRVKGCSVPQIGVLNAKGEGDPWKWVPFYKMSKALATAKKAATASRKKEGVVVKQITPSLEIAGAASNTNPANPATNASDSDSYSSSSFNSE